MYWRIVRTLMAVLLFSTVLNAVFLAVTARGAAHRAQEATLGRFARYASRQVGHALARGGDLGDVRQLLELAVADFPQVQIAYAPKSGPPIATRDAESSLVSVARAGGGPELIILEHWPRRAGIAPVFVRGQPAGTVAVAVARSQLMGTLAILHWTGIVMVPLLFAVSALAGLLALRWLRRRLSPVSEVLTAIHAGDLTRRLPDQETDDIGQLYRAFNRMAERVQETIERLGAMDRRRREFLLEVAHELRTPMTAVEGSLEVMMMKAGPEDQHLARAYGEAVRIGGLISDLLESARMEEPRYSLNVGRVNLQRSLSRVLARYGLLFERRGLQVRTRFTEDPIFLELDERRMEQAVGNVLQNALDHATAGGKLDVTVTPGAEQTLVEFRDDGEGMPPERLEQVRDGTCELHGHGIGLAVVRKLVEMHGGRVELESAPGQGTRVTLVLPAPAVA